jgi:putative hydrolase of the HAD superfamily
LTRKIGMPSPLFGQISALLFDLGGTLDGEGLHWLDRFYLLYEEAGLSIPRKEIKEAFYHADALCCADPEVNEIGLRPLMNRHVKIQMERLRIGDAGVAEKLSREFCAGVEAHLERNLQVLKRLRRRYRLGVITNYYGNAEVILREAGFGSILEMVLDSTRIGVSKPDQALFTTALSRLGLQAEQAVFIGDSYERDMVPAHRLGMKTVWIPGPRPRFTPEPGVVTAAIDRLEELERFL